MMRKVKMGFGIVFTMILIVLFVGVVNAEDTTTKTRTEEIVELLEESLKSTNGVVTYEDGAINISYAMKNEQITDISFAIEGNIIKYETGEIADYEDAELVTSHSIMAIKLIYAALELNGYSSEKITAFFGSETNFFDYAVNGISIKKLGTSAEYVSDDGSSTITVAPLSIIIDVKKANLNTTAEEVLPASTTTIAGLVNYLKKDKSFITIEDKGLVLSENSISIEDDFLTISNTIYTYDWYYVTLPCEDDVLSYAVEEIEDYDTAESVLSHSMFGEYVMNLALKLNGYTAEQIKSFTENHSFDYELNGIEIKDLGEEKEYVSDDETESILASPLSIKIDLVKANLNIAVPEKEEAAQEETTVIPDKEEKSISPKTGDNVLMYLGMLIFGGVSLIGIFIKRRELASK